MFDDAFLFEYFPVFPEDMFDDRHRDDLFFELATCDCRCRFLMAVNRKQILVFP